MLIKQDAQTIHTVVLDDCRNTIEEFVAVARYHAKVEFSQGYRDRVTASRKSLEATIASGVGVYGVNTGFGDNVRYRITEDEMVQLQENILRSHGCSVGRALSEEEARALMLMQLMSIGKGYSAVSLEMLEQIRTYLNADLYPYAPCEGTIGGPVLPALHRHHLYGRGPPDRWRQGPPHRRGAEGEGHRPPEGEGPGRVWPCCPTPATPWAWACWPFTTLS